MRPAPVIPQTASTATIPANRTLEKTRRAIDSHWTASQPMPRTGCGSHRGSPRARSNTTADRIWYSSLITIASGGKSGRPRYFGERRLPGGPRPLRCRSAPRLLQGVAIRDGFAGGRRTIGETHRRRIRRAGTCPKPCRSGCRPQRSGFANRSIASCNHSLQSGHDEFRIRRSPDPTAHAWPKCGQASSQQPERYRSQARPDREILRPTIRHPADRESAGRASGSRRKCR